ncbi:MAG: tRNA epoxyqueuosine(34) reductase QueG [Rhodocyclaceae bacterium]|nr:tRNA epoxyqueuosine(34) reductase QueG [Rhodocyclaceae bacterium]
MHGAESDRDGRVAQIREWGRELGFVAVGIAGVRLDRAEIGLNAWLAAGKHGSMDYMARHGSKRSRPAELLPGTRSVISVRLPYGPASNTVLAEAEAALHDLSRAYVSRYALGRDYHTVLRKRLQSLADRMTAGFGDFGYRVFTDSAPVMEVELAAQSGLGWRGKHTLLLDRRGGSWSFLGEILCDLDLPTDAPVADHCGTCTACLDSCPTEAFDGPYQLDARRCISYLTIELKESIPEPLRAQMGNRIYGCDDCQLACPWNRFAEVADEPDFSPRNDLDIASLVSLFAWTETEFLERMAGSPIRRIGHERWLRNIAVALGNAPTMPSVVDALRRRCDDPSPMVREHVEWALARHIPQVGAGETAVGGSASTARRPSPGRGCAKPSPDTR